MPLSEKRTEIQRLITSFEAESSKFHATRLSTLYVTQESVNDGRKFSSPNHCVLLWQYYGRLGTEDTNNQLLTNLGSSDLKWGVRGAQLSRYAVIEGDYVDLFVRMAQRAGSLFDSTEAFAIKSQVLSEILDREKAEAIETKPVAVANDNSVAVWLNYLLFHLSLTNPGREHARKIDPDPFSLSLLALERMAEELKPGKIDRSVSRVAEIKFKVAMSFPGEKRSYVGAVVKSLRPEFSSDSIFYDFDYQAQLARPNLDTLLQHIYRKQSDLIVVFLCKEYAQKEWCGLEWRAVRDIIKSKQDDRVMFIRFDDAEIDGVFAIDGYFDGNKFSAEEVARLIAERVASLPMND